MGSCIWRWNHLLHIHSSYTLIVQLHNRIKSMPQHTC
uniref:Uncharacterized protein n=1 Tax=Ascaris lumbricoides TaxID=6252 RepID=A0A0M3HMF5_ASCLU